MEYEVTFNSEANRTIVADVTTVETTTIRVNQLNSARWSNHKFLALGMGVGLIAIGDALLRSFDPTGGWTEVRVLGEFMSGGLVLINSFFYWDRKNKLLKSVQKKLKQQTYSPD